MAKDKQTQRPNRSAPADKPLKADPLPPRMKTGAGQAADDDHVQDAMDQAIEDSFPASDPPGHTSPT